MSYREHQLVPSAARTATGAAAAAIDTFNGAIEGRSNPDARFYLNITAAAGTTPTLVLELWGTINGVDYLLGAFPSKSVAGKDTLVIPACPRHVTPKWTIGGTTPSFTFTVDSSRS